jgi:glutathione S-transferase
MLNFYASPLSPFVTKVHYFLEEAGIPYKYHQVNLRDEKAKAELARVNPFGKVPAIELNGFGLGESNAILRYLIERYQVHQLYPANLEDRAQVDQAFEFVQAHVNRWVMALAWNLGFSAHFGVPADQHAINEARSQLPGTLARLESYLNGRTYLAGHDFSLADVVLLPALAQHKAAQVSLADYPNVSGWLERASARPAWKKTHAEVERRQAEILAKR